MTIQQLSEEIRVKIAEAIQSKEIQTLVEKTKAATDSGNFEVVISTGDIDRQGEAVDQNGLDFTFYKMNPVVLWAHDYYGLPIGITDEIGVQDGKTIAKGRFAPADANPFAQQIRKLYDLKIVQTTSIGMIVKEKNGNIITKAELLEYSFVPVPANPFALSLSKAQELGLDLAMLATKGIVVEEKLAAEGDEHEKAAKDQTIKEITKFAQFKSAINSIKELLATLERLLGGDAGKVLLDGEVQKQRSQDEGLAVIKQMDEFLMTRQILKSITNQASEALERMNKKLRSKRRA